MEQQPRRLLSLWLVVETGVGLQQQQLLCDGPGNPAHLQPRRMAVARFRRCQLPVIVGVERAHYVKRLRLSNKSFYIFGVQV